MKITIESTSKIVHLNGIPARVWEGQTESGVLIHCYVTRVAVSTGNAPSVFAEIVQALLDARVGVHDLCEFERELQEQRPPSPEIEALPSRMIL